MFWRISMKTFLKCLVSISIFAISPTSSAAAATQVGKLYTMSNATTGNEILAYNRLSDGSLSPLGTMPTKGTGTGSGLGNQGAITLSSDGFFLFAVNAGSNSVSSFRITPTGLNLVNTFDSGGVSPVSITEDRGRMFVLNAGNASTPGNIFGFQVSSDGSLRKMYYTMRSLSDRKVTTGAAQVSFSNNGKQLIVTEKTTNLILTYNVNILGIPSRPIINPSSGITPFGFAVGKRNQIFVSNAAGGAADASSLSSYSIASKDPLQLISPEVATQETAACWVVLTPDGRYAFTTNTGSGTISSFLIDFDGKATLANDDAGVTGQGTGPIDMGISPDSKHLYTLNSGNASISSFMVGEDGNLTSAGATSGLPAGANGLAIQ
jgi:6-phosphogluconolactonase (cycloisomerase 2 family)